MPIRTSAPYATTRNNNVGTVPLVYVDSERVSENYPEPTVSPSTHGNGDIPSESMFQRFVTRPIGNLLRQNTQEVAKSDNQDDDEDEHFEYCSICQENRATMIHSDGRLFCVYCSTAIPSIARNVRAF